MKTETSQKKTPTPQNDQSIPLNFSCYAISFENKSALQALVEGKFSEQYKDLDKNVALGAFHPNVKTDEDLRLLAREAATSKKWGSSVICFGYEENEVEKLLQEGKIHRAIQCIYESKSFFQIVFSKLEPKQAEKIDGTHFTPNLTLSSQLDFGHF